ncbi:MAG: MBL fold metallo-hydrolase [Planctomycetota bacterium]
MSTTTSHDHHSRRTALKLAVGAGLAAAALPLAAQTPQAQGRTDVAPSGSYKITIGRIELHLVADGTLEIPLAQTFAINGDLHAAKRQLRERYLPAEGPGPVPVNGLLIKAPDATILIDAGAGPGFQPGGGHLGAHLRALGVTPDDLDAVVLTHMHFDHMRGLIAEGSRDLFASAEILMPTIERDFWAARPALDECLADEGTKENLRTAATDVLGALGTRLRTITTTEQLATGVRLVPLPGHTPGHVGVEIESEGEQLLYISDLFHVAALHLPRPDWFAAFDTDGPAAVETRRTTLDRVAADRLRIAGTHIPFPGTGHVRRDGAAYDWQPDVWRF